ncbi:hypothetical protein KSC_092880 [Ktedonobacter sp. SOSP1-52]|nr:hypothetical protein KSC_092880 [Ktedonobacter sp. SOSP1-52]
MIRLVLTDLVLLDYHLPQMDGLAFLAHLRTSIESEQIPVVLISGSLPAYLPRHQNVIALKKPFDVDILLEHVTYLLGDSASD